MGNESFKQFWYVTLFICTSSIGFTQEWVIDSAAFQFTVPDAFTSGIEGPAVDRDGRLFAVNFDYQGTIGVVDSNGQCSLFAQLPEGSIANGIRFDGKGNMFIADYTRHNILFIEKGTDRIRVFAHDSLMNQPNDIAIDSRGWLYASDPNWEEETGQLWGISPEGKVELLETGMGTTNGIEVSPEEDRLYVNESAQLRIWAYDLDKKGGIRNKTLFFQFDDYGLDGMRCDQAGNLFVTRYGKGTVVVLSPKGEVLAEVRLNGMRPSNLAFGGHDGKTVYVTLADKGCFDSFRTHIPGRSFLMWK